MIVHNPLEDTFTKYYEGNTRVLRRLSNSTLIDEPSQRFRSLIYNNLNTTEDIITKIVVVEDSNKPNWYKKIYPDGSWLENDNSSTYWHYNNHTDVYMQNGAKVVEVF